MQRSWQLLAKGNGRLNKKRPDRTRKRQTNARKWKARRLSKVLLFECRMWQGKQRNCHKETKTFYAPPMTSTRTLVRDSRVRLGPRSRVRSKLSASNAPMPTTLLSRRPLTNISNGRLDSCRIASGHQAYQRSSRGRGCGSENRQCDQGRCRR